MEVGGQAVIEGVMMRNKEKFAVAVRLPNGEIKIKKDKSTYFPKVFNIFFLRGIVGLGYTIYDGVRALSWSSSQQLQEEEKITKKELIATIVVSLLFSVLIFVVLPFFSAHLLFQDGVLFNLVDGIFRAILFLGYLLAISSMKDVKTLFQYHGAEHKSIYCYEQKKELTLENVKTCSRFHPRCGTTFLFIIVLLSIGVFSFITGPWWVKLTGRLLLLPAIAGIGYEIIKLSGRYHHNPFVKALITPGLWLQRITTKEPTDKQLEVGIASLKAVLE
ncbi:DUF1385 domain-containing protein [Candidatus Woesearchaeota archaeon]|nr:DUF1385 domain-containing protein [Candidatus Woesearchaeota archaeon]